LLEGALKLDKIVGYAIRDLAPAIAITDTNNLFGALEFAQKAAKEGLQPIIGCQLHTLFADAVGESSLRKSGPGAHALVLIAATEEGYANLVRLVSRAYLDNAPGEAIHIQSAWLEE